MDSDLEELNNEKANSQPLAQRIQTSRSHERSAMSGDEPKKPSDKMLTLVAPTRPSGERAVTHLEMEKLAVQTALEFRACSRELRTLRPKIQHIQDYFASSVRGSVTLVGCSSFKEYCERKLGRTRQAIYALLGNYPQKQKEKQKLQPKGERVYNGGFSQEDVTRMQTGLNAVYRFQVAKSNGNEEEARCAWQEYERIASAEPLKSRIAGDQPLVRAQAEQELRAAACNREVLGRKGQQAEIGCGRLVGPFRCCTCVRGDAMELLMELPMWAVDGAVTDPPYGLRLAAWDSRVPYHLLGRFLQISDGPVVWFGAAPVMTEACTMFDPQPERVLIWAPKFTLANARSKGIAYRFHPIYVWRVPEEHDGPTWDVLDVATEAGNWWRHPCTKPVALMKLLCRLVPEGGLILDPFAGSGSTLVAARLTGRHFLGFEMEQNYCDIIQARLRGKPSQRLE